MGFLSSSTLPPSITTATVQKVYNETIALADTEQSLVMPTNILGYLIRTRGIGELKLTHASGESGTKYVTIPGGASFSNDKAFESITLYFQSPSIGEIVEVVAWS